MMAGLKEEGVARFIGFSSMNSAEKSRQILEYLDIDVCLLAMNPTQYGDFVKVALPVAQQKNVGVIAMKVMKNIVGKKATASELLEYALTQEGVSTACIGHFGVETLQENIHIVRQLEKKTTAAIHREELEKRLADMAGPHALCWAHPDYKDGMMC